MNSEFENYPVEFKKLDPEDFPIFLVGQKSIIQPNSEGYINDAIQSKIDLEEKNTVVINAAVGQGKTYSIIEIVKQYYQSEQDYLIFIASPFISLVKQYVDNLQSQVNIPQEKIFSYENIGEEEYNEEDLPTYLDKPIHIITANTLLGNPGEEGFRHSEEKRIYLSNLSSFCEAKRVPVVFIYDEIHDSYYNFKQKYIFNLWKWKNVVHKNFIISATYNEASKVVIEYLAELTDRKIQLIESKRVLFPERQSKLYLHYSDDNIFNVETREIKNTIEQLVARGKQIDILCYSKSLSKNIVSPRSDLGKLLNETFGEIQDCTSITKEDRTIPENRYDNTKCNVGTNFKTGVSIKKENHAFVIILPPSSSEKGYINKYGIFSGGINSVIQALARQRYVENTQNEIHIILSKPNEFDYSSLDYTSMRNEQKVQFKSLYDRVVQRGNYLVEYKDLNVQEAYLRNFYEQELKGYLSTQIEVVNSIDRNGLPKLEFPDYKTFVLEDGEDYLANNYPIYGEDISSYVTFAAITNQFVNCKLQNILASRTLFFTEENINSELIAFYDSNNLEIKLSPFITYGNFSIYYYTLKDILLKRSLLKFKRVNSNKYQSDKITLKIFEKYLLTVARRWYFGVQQQEEYTRADYLSDGIEVALELDPNNITDEVSKNRVLLFRAIGHFKKKLIENIHEYTSRGKHYYYIRVDNNFGLDNTDLSMLEQIQSLIQYDDFLSQDIYNFRRSILNKPPSKQINSLYKILKSDLLELGAKHEPSINGTKCRVKEVVTVRLVNPYPINFLSPQLDLDRKRQDEIDLVGEEVYNEMQTELNTILSDLNPFDL